MPEDSGLRSVGVFEDFEDAKELIKELPEILLELGLRERFDVLGSPAEIVERQKRGLHTRYENVYYAAQIRDRTPSLPPPDITLHDISVARATVKRREQERLERERQAAEEEARYTAFGRQQPLATWAQTFGTSVATVNRYVERFGDLETALTKIALKKHKAA